MVANATRGSALLIVFVDEDHVDDNDDDDDDDDDADNDDDGCTRLRGVKCQDDAWDTNTSRNTETITAPLILVFFWKSQSRSLTGFFFPTRVQELKSRALTKKKKRSQIILTAKKTKTNALGGDRSDLLWG